LKDTINDLIFNLKEVTDAKIEEMMQNITVTLPDGSSLQGNMTDILQELEQ
jgi:hypothetical protein